jgi:hypothetical protein
MEICFCCCNKCNNGMLWLKLPFIKLNTNSHRYIFCMTYKTDGSIWLRLPSILRFLLPHYEMNSEDYEE